MIDWSKLKPGSSPAPEATDTTAPVAPSGPGAIPSLPSLPGATQGPQASGPFGAVQASQGHQDLTQQQVDALNPFDRIGRGIDELGNTLFGRGNGSPLGGVPLLGDIVGGAGNVIHAVGSVGVAKPFEIGENILSGVPLGWLPGGADDNFRQIGDWAKANNPLVYQQWQMVNAASNADFFHGGNMKADFNMEFDQFLSDASKEGMDGVDPILAQGRTTVGSLGGALSHAIQGWLGLPSAQAQKWLGQQSIFQTATDQELTANKGHGLGVADRLGVIEHRAATGAELNPVEQAVVTGLAGGWTREHALDYLVSHGEGISRNPVEQILGTALTDPLTYATLGAGGFAAAGAAGTRLAESGFEAETTFQKLAATVSAVQQSELGPAFRFARGLIDPLGVYKPSTVERAVTDLRNASALDAFGRSYGYKVVGAVRALARKFDLTDKVDSAMASYSIDKANEMMTVRAQQRMVAEGFGEELLQGAVHPDEIASTLSQFAGKYDATEMVDYMSRIAKNTFTAEEDANLAGRMASTFGQDVPYWKNALGAMSVEQRSMLHALTYKMTESDFEAARAMVNVADYHGDLPLDNMVLMSPEMLDNVRADSIIAGIKTLLSSGNEDKIAAATAEWNAQAQRFPALSRIGYAPGGQSQLESLVADLQRQLDRGQIAKRAMPDELNSADLRPIRDFVDRYSVPLEPGEAAPAAAAAPAVPDSPARAATPAVFGRDARGNAVLPSVFKDEPGYVYRVETLDTAEGGWPERTGVTTGKPTSFYARDDSHFIFRAKDPGDLAAGRHGAGGADRLTTSEVPSSQIEMLTADGSWASVEGIPAPTMYHGSPTTGLTSATATPATRQYDNATSVFGAFVTPSRTEAARYAGKTGQVYEAAAETLPKNPYEMTRKEFNYFQSPERDATGAMNMDNLAQRMEELKTEAQALKDRLVAEGYDGIRVPGNRGNATEIASFSDINLRPEGTPPTPVTPGSKPLWNIGWRPDEEVAWGLRRNPDTHLPEIDRAPTISHVVDAVPGRQPFSDTTRNVMGQIIGKSKAERLNKPIDSMEAYFNTMRDVVTGQRLANNLARRYERISFDAGVPKNVSSEIWQKVREVAALNQTTVKGIKPANLWTEIGTVIPKDFRLADGSTMDIHIVMDHVLKAAEGDLRVMGLSNVLAQRIRNALRKMGDSENISGQLTVTQYNKLRYAFNPMFIIQRVTDGPYFSILYGVKPIGRGALEGGNAELRAIEDNLGRTGLARDFSMDQPEFATRSNFTAGIKDKMQEMGLQENKLSKIAAAPDVYIANNMTNMLHARLGDVVRGTLENLKQAAKDADPAVRADMIAAADELDRSFGDWREMYSTIAGRPLNDNEVGLAYIQDQINAQRRVLLGPNHTLDMHRIIAEGERAIPNDIGELGPLRPGVLAEELGYPNEAALRDDITGTVQRINGQFQLVKGEHDINSFAEDLRTQLHAHPDYVKRAVAYFSDTPENFWYRLSQPLDKGGLDISPHYAKEAQNVIAMWARERGMNPWEYLSGAMLVNLGADNLETAVGQLVSFLKGGPLNASTGDWGTFLRAHLDLSAQRTLVDAWKGAAGTATKRTAADFKKFFDSGIEDLLKKRVAEGPHANADVEAAIQQVAKLVQTTLKGTPAEGATRSQLRSLTEAIPVTHASPFNKTHALVVSLLKNKIEDLQTDIFRLAEMQTRRSVLERSLNHPVFGLYPVSYMWGKVLPETVKFIAKNPFAATYVIADVQRAIAIQREYDPEMDHKVSAIDRSAGAFLLDYVTPGLPWSDHQARMAPWVRDLQAGHPGLILPDELSTMGTDRWYNNLTRAINEVPGAVQSLQQGEQQAPPWAAGLQSLPSAPPTGVTPEAQQITGPTKAAGLAPILSEDLARLQSVLLSGGSPER